MDANVGKQLSRLSGLEADMEQVRRSLSDYSGALKTAWGGSDGAALCTGAERLSTRSRSIENELGRLYDDIVKAEREREAEEAARRAAAEAAARAAEEAARKAAEEAAARAAEEAAKEAKAQAAAKSVVESALRIFRKQS